MRLVVDVTKGGSMENCFMKMEVCERRFGQKATINVSGNVDRLSDCISLRQKVYRLMEEKVSSITLDLREVSFISASFCGFLVGIPEQIKAKGITFCIAVNPESIVGDIFSQVGIDRVIHICAAAENCSSTMEPEAAV